MECASSMEQRWRWSDASVKDAQILLGKWGVCVKHGNGSQPQTMHQWKMHQSSYERRSVHEAWRQTAKPNDELCGSEYHKTIATLTLDPTNRVLLVLHHLSRNRRGRCVILMRQLGLSSIDLLYMQSRHRHASNNSEDILLHHGRTSLLMPLLQLCVRLQMSQ